MRLAFVTSLIPVTRPDTGFEIANAAIIDALRAADHHVTVFGFARPDDVPRDDPDSVLIDRMVIENSVATKRQKAVWLAAALVHRLPIACAKLRHAGRGRVVETIRAQGPFDGIILNSVTMAGAFPEITKIAPSILVEHNIEHVSARQSARHATSHGIGQLYLREARLLEAIERKLWRDCRFIWCLAQEDRHGLGAASQDKSAVLPLVPPALAAPLPKAAPANDIGLIGTWTWEPNLIGLKWFLTEVTPHLAAGLKVAVAGRLPDGLEAPPNVTLLGRVPDAASFLASCRVIALTSRAGTGVQLKTIEVLGHGLPAVATPLSMRGLTATPANVLVAETARSFAKALEEHVARARDGLVGRVEGWEFLQAQTRAQGEAIVAGLASIDRQNTTEPFPERISYAR